MNSDDLKSLISQGENNSLEFKNKAVRIESLAKEIVAFLNASGGTILIGVEDDGQISGVDLDKNWEEWCANIVRQNINPPVSLKFNLVADTNLSIVVLTIPKGVDKPYQTFDGKFYIRVGSTNRVASPQELMRLFQQSGIFHFDLIGVDGTSAKQLNYQKLAGYFEKYKLDFELLNEQEKSDLLINTDIATEDLRLTVAGLMIFGINPQKYLRNASISFAHFEGNIISEKLYNKQNIEGNLDYQIDTATAIIKNNLKTPSEIKGNQRVENNSYPEKVFRELIVNACCHRNYSIYGSKTRIMLFDDRLEVISPGKLPNTVTIEKLKAGVSYAVNPVIVKFMENLNYIDKLGRGLPMVHQEARKLGKEVVFEEFGEEFKVKLYL